MSGGHFDYQQYHISDIADSLEEYIYGRQWDDEDIQDLDNQVLEGWKTQEEADYIKLHKHDVPNFMEFGKETMEELIKGLDILRKASIYAQRIDWLISGDDGEDSFLNRLRSELKDYEMKH